MDTNQRHEQAQAMKQRIMEKRQAPTGKAFGVIGNMMGLRKVDVALFGTIGVFVGCGLVLQGNSIVSWLGLGTMVLGVALYVRSWPWIK